MNTTGQIKNIPLGRVRHSRWQPRQTFDPDTLHTLALSIQANGLINAPLVFPIDVKGNPYKPSTTPPYYELVAGERRWRALCALRLSEHNTTNNLETWCSILAKTDPRDVGNMPQWAGDATFEARLLLELTTLQLHRLVVSENLDRDDLTPLDIAHALNDLMVANEWTQSRLAKELGRSQPWISQRLSLLDLDDNVQDALKTQEISPTHARAISRVPQAAQGAVTDWVKTNADQITTRDLEKTTRLLAAFTNPDRWQPNSNTIYQPEAYNRLYFIRWLISQADLDANAGNLLSIRDTYPHGNLLSKQPKTIAESMSFTKTIIDALGFRNTKYKDLWSRFAKETNRTCQQCVISDYQPPLELESSIEIHCPAWENANLNQCDNFIGPNDPLILPLDHWIEYTLRKSQIPYQKEPFDHLQSVPDYIHAYDLAVEYLRQKNKDDDQKKQTGYIDAIFDFFNWQQTLPPADLDHFQSHACHKCRHFNAIAPGGSEGERCHFMIHPLTGYQDQPRAPHFGILVSQAGQLLPRCERFSYRDLPTLYPTPGGVQLPDHNQVLRWLRKLASHNSIYNYSYFATYGVLAWLPTDRDPGSSSELEKVIRWVRSNWDDIGGDPVIPTLIDAAIYEAKIVNGCKRPSKFLNPTTGEEELFSGCNFDYMDGPPNWNINWPEGFPKPWETPLPEAELVEAGPMVEPAEAPVADPIEAEYIFPLEEATGQSIFSLSDQLNVPADSILYCQEILYSLSGNATDLLTKFNDDPIAAARHLALNEDAPQFIIDAIDETLIQKLENLIAEPTS